MKTLMMIRRMKEVLTWVWIAVIGETTEFLYGQRFGT